MTSRPPSKASRRPRASRQRRGSWPPARAVTRAVDVAEAQLHEAISRARGTCVVVADLGRAIEEIAGILDTISAVARQTSLLALNATIGAAQAGPAGQDFALVANDIKSLSVGDRHRRQRDPDLRPAAARRRRRHARGRKGPVGGRAQLLFGTVRIAVTERSNVLGPARGAGLDVAAAVARLGDQVGDRFQRRRAGRPLRRPPRWPPMPRHWQTVSPSAS